MGLIDNQRRILLEHGIPLTLGQQDAIRHKLDAGFLARFVLKAHLIANEISQWHPQLFSNPCGHARCRNPSRLGAANSSRSRTQGLCKHLGQLRRLARSGVTDNDHHLMLFQGSKDLFAVFDNRKLLWVVPVAGNYGHAGSFPLTGLVATAKTVRIWIDLTRQDSKPVQEIR